MEGWEMVTSVHPRLLEDGPRIDFSSGGMYNDPSVKKQVCVREGEEILYQVGLDPLAG